MAIRPIALLFSLIASVQAADPIFSGPQPGEKTTPFKVVEITGANADKERVVITDKTSGATAIVFMHGIERSMMPLLRVVDEYGAMRKDSLKTEIIFLSADRLQGAQRAKNTAGSMKFQSRVGLSLDGAEGPGNYGLNKDCLMTIVIAKDNTVTSSFALSQPGIADAPKVLEALAKVSGDANPPTMEELNQRLTARNGDGIRRGGDMPPTVDLTKFDLKSEEGLRGAVLALIGEVRSLRTELNAVRGGNPQRPAQPRAQQLNEGAGKGPFPGAVPTDPALEGMLRRYIKPTNDDATVDAILVEVRGHIKDSADLKKQAIDGWTRVLHFGDTYGTEYARTKGKAFLDDLKK